MIEVTRILSAWAAHPQHGVNAQLAFVPRLHLDGVTQDPAPPAVTIYNDVDDVDGNEPGLSHDLEPTEVPALVVTVGEGTGHALDVTDQHYLKTGGVVTVDFAYITRVEAGGIDSVERARMDGMYTLRALRRSLWRIGRRGTAADRVLNGMQVLYVSQTTIYRISGGAGRSQMHGFLRALAHVVDTTP